MNIQVNEQAVYLVAGLAVLATIVAIISSRYANKPRYEKRTLFTPAEKHFLATLNKAVGDQYRIFGKVRIADVLMPKKGLSRKRRNQQFWKVSSKHFDYVLCDPKTLDIVCAIELNDSSHNAKSRIDRDRFVNEACRSAKLPMVWIPARKNYDTRQIAKIINDHIKKQAA